MTFDEWTIRWPQAAAELQDMLISDCSGVGSLTGTSEAEVQAAVRIEASVKGARLWRNNVGVLKDLRGIPVRYGLCNDSKAVNEKIKSADLIGIRPTVITSVHLGKIVGVFLSREVKAQSWKYTSTDREKAQLKWAALINTLGGDARIVTGVGSI